MQADTPQTFAYVLYERQEQLTNQQLAWQRLLRIAKHGSIIATLTLLHILSAASARQVKTVVPLKQVNSPQSVLSYKLND